MKCEFAFPGVITLSLNYDAARLTLPFGYENVEN